MLWSNNSVKVRARARANLWRHHNCTMFLPLISLQQVLLFSQIPSVHTINVMTGHYPLCPESMYSVGRIDSVLDGGTPNLVTYPGSNAGLSRLGGRTLSITHPTLGHIHTMERGEGALSMVLVYMQIIACLLITIITIVDLHLQSPSSPKLFSCCPS